LLLRVLDISIIVKTVADGVEINKPMILLCCCSNWLEGFENGYLLISLAHKPSKQVIGILKENQNIY